MSQITDSSLKALVISLPESVERRSLMQHNMSKLAISWKYIDACKCDADSDYVVDYSKQIIQFGRKLTPGEIGVFKSHMLALTEFSKDPALTWLLVLEDDVWVDPDFDFYSLTVLLEKRKIGYLRLFCRQWMGGKHICWFNERQIVRLNTDPYGMQGYLISREAAEKFRKFVRSIVRPIDDEIGRFWEHGLTIYMVFPFPIIERSIVSTLLQERIELNRTKNLYSLRRWIVKIRDYVKKRTYLVSHSFSIK